jgi:hypothetical protein
VFLALFFSRHDRYRSLEFASDVTVALLEQRSWAQARTAAFRHLRTLGGDIVELLKLPFRWMTYAFTVIALLWGVLVPIDLFEPVGGTLLAVLMWGAFTAFPFTFSFYIADDVLGADRGDDIDWCIVGCVAGMAPVVQFILPGDPHPLDRLAHFAFSCFAVRFPIILTLGSNDTSHNPNPAHHHYE